MNITSFTGRYSFLSNFYECPRNVTVLGMSAPTAEHVFQGLKATDREDQHRITSADSPAEAKRLGRHVTLRPDWEVNKRALMLEVVLAKFTQSQELRAKLIATGDATLVEGNTWGDRYWGAVQADRGAIPVDADIWAPGDIDGSRWLAGENWLGRTLMVVRMVLA